MDEYISREDVLKKAKSSISVPADNEWDCGYNTAMAEIQEFIKQLPATDVQSVPQWISVKDGLPDENQKCLVYRDIDADLKITTGIWHSEWRAFDGLRHGTRLEDTIAWMSLPEPPKEGDIE